MSKKVTTPFQKSKQPIQNYTNYRDIFRYMSWGGSIKVLIFFVCLGIILRLGQFLSEAANKIKMAASEIAINSLSKSLGKEMIKDENGNINMLLVGFGGGGHAGGYLADSIIFASFNTIHNTTTMVSIPRDLYITTPDFSNRVNAVFAFAYSNSQGDLDYAANMLSDKIGDILGVTIPYYALIDFRGFERFVDSIGGVDIDIPYALYDNQYPDEAKGRYVVFQLEPGPQKLDGPTALKYARSRHSTSDFSRSQRQQVIIKGIVDQLRNSGIFKSPSAIQGLYQQYTNMVFTNIAVEEMIGMIKHLQSPPHISSFGLTMECADLSYRTMQPGCLLYPGVRDDFGGMSVLLPRGATGRNPSMYEYTQFFGYMVIDNPGFLKEQAKITVYNAIDPAYARRYIHRNGLATKLASKLIRYGFNIDDVGNADEFLGTTRLLVNAETGSYIETRKMLGLYFDFETIYKDGSQREIALISGSIDDPAILGEARSDPLEVDIIQQDISNQLPNIEIYLGNDFIDRFGTRAFDMYMK